MSRTVAVVRSSPPRAMPTSDLALAAESATARRCGAPGRQQPAQVVELNVGKAA